MHEIISRDEARKAGLRYFFTGRPCINGNFERRLVSIRRCICAQCTATRLDGKRAWREKNRDVVASHSKARHRRCRDKNLECFKASYRKNKEQRLAKNKEWREKNKDRDRINKARWLAANQDRNRAKSAKYRARINLSVPSWFGEFDEFVACEASELCVSRQLATGVKWHIDHMIPLKATIASGLHCGKNLQVIPSKLNHSKRNRMILILPNEWISAI